MFTRLPTAAEKLFSATLARDGRRWTSAFTVVISTAGAAPI